MAIPTKDTMKKINEKVNASPEVPIVVDLFAGVGGLSLGFAWAGFHSSLHVENDRTCVEALEKNFPNTPIIDKDIRTVTVAQIRKHFPKPKSEVDFVIGGPPCQGFSLIGLRDPNDPRSGLIFEFHRIVSELRPKFFVMENVPGIISANKGAFLAKLIDLLEGDGYKIQKPITTLVASDFGVPQERKRVFIVGVRSDIDFEFKYPKPTHKKSNSTDLQKLPLTPNVFESISDLPDVERFPHLVEGDTVAYTGEPAHAYVQFLRGETKFAGLRLVRPKNWNKLHCTGCRRTVHGPVLTKRFIETEHGKVVPVSRLYKLDPNKVATTLRAGTPRERGAHSSPRPVHPFVPRVITVREGARLQSFPDWHQFHHTKWHGFRQVGNAVPPLLAYNIAKQFAAYYSK